MKVTNLTCILGGQPATGNSFGEENGNENLYSGSSVLQNHSHREKRHECLSGSRYTHSSGAATSAHRSLKSARSTDAPRVGKMQRCRRAQRLDPLRFQLPAGLAQKQLAERLAMAYPLGPDLLFPPEPREVQMVLRPRERSGCLGFHATLHCRKKQVLSAASWRPVWGLRLPTSRPCGPRWLAAGAAARVSAGSGSELCLDNSAPSAKSPGRAGSRIAPPPGAGRRSESREDTLALPGLRAPASSPERSG